MKPIEFEQDEAQFLVTAANERVKATGLVNAQVAIRVVAKLQQAATEDKKPDAPTGE